MNIRIVSLAVVVLDQVSKLLVIRYCRLDESITLISNFLYLSYIHNTGAAFGFLANTQASFRIPFFITITIGAALIVYSFQRILSPEKKLARFSLGLIWGGALGNFIDRIFYRQVVDFIDVRYYQHKWYVFNLADSSITVGLVVLAALYLFEKPDKPIERP